MKTWTEDSHIIVGDRPVGVHCKLRLWVFLGAIAWLALYGLVRLAIEAWRLL